MAKATETSVDKTISQQQLVSLIKEDWLDKTKIGAVNEGRGARITSGVDNHHLHRGAFNLVSRLYRMDELKRADFIRSLDLYVDMCEEAGLFGAEHSDDIVDLAEANAKAKPRARKAGGKDDGMDGADASGSTRVQ
jgi:hypothetical protein